MFREMRRKKQLLPPEETERILREGTTGVLAVIGDEGYPYAVPLNYVYADGRIFFHCAKAGHKIDAIRACDQVSFAVIAEDRVNAAELSTEYRSVILFGRAKILESEEDLRRAARLLSLKYSSDLPKIEREIEAELPALCCVEITPEQTTGKEAKSLALARMKKE